MNERMSHAKRIGSIPIMIRPEDQYIKTKLYESHHSSISNTLKPPAVPAFMTRSGCKA